MRKTFALAALVALLVAVGAAGQKPLDPAWQSTGDGRLVRKLDVECTRFPAGNTTNYRFETFGKAAITATESDGGKAASVELAGAAALDVKRDEKGRTTLVKVRIAQVLHVDLNADGVFDGSYDAAANQTWIILDGRPVEVEGSKVFLDLGAARSRDHKAEYVFDKGKWKAR